MHDGDLDDLDSRGTVPGTPDGGNDERFRVRFALSIAGLWVIAFGKQLVGGTAPPPELSAAFAAVVAYILRSGSKGKD